MALLTFSGGFLLWECSNLSVTSLSTQQKSHKKQILKEIAFSHEKNAVFYMHFTR